MEDPETTLNIHSDIHISIHHVWWPLLLYLLFILLGFLLIPSSWQYVHFFKRIPCWDTFTWGLFSWWISLLTSNQLSLLRHRSRGLSRTSANSFADSVSLGGNFCPPTPPKKNGFQASDWERKQFFCSSSSLGDTKIHVSKRLEKGRLEKTCQEQVGEEWLFLQVVQWK